MGGLRGEEWIGGSGCGGERGAVNQGRQLFQIFPPKGDNYLKGGVIEGQLFLEEIQ